MTPPKTPPVSSAPQPCLLPLPVTFVILTQDEERSLPACLDSLAGIADDVHVVDSGSTDGTAAVALARGVPIRVHPFRGFGAQRNWAIDNVPHRYDWAFHLDADERMTLPLAREIADVLASSPDEAGFHVPSKLLLGGRWLRRAGSYPVYQVRLFHRRRLRFADHGHGQREVTAGWLGRLREPYLHEAFSKGLDEWLAKHASYARREAEQHSANAGSLLRDLRELLTKDRITRRRAAKRLSYRLPARPTLRLLELLLLRGAFLDGRPGVVYARMLATYESMISLHLAARRCDPAWFQLGPDPARREDSGG